MFANLFDKRRKNLPTKARMTVKKEATGKVTFMLNSSICSKSTVNFWKISDHNDLQKQPRAFCFLFLIWVLRYGLCEIIKFEKLWSFQNFRH